MPIRMPTCALKALARLAERHGVVVHVSVLPGAMVHPARRLMAVQGHVDSDLRDAMIMRSRLSGIAASTKILGSD